MISLFSAFIPKEAGEEVKKTIDSSWINTGEKEALFKKNLNEKFGFKYSVATNSCTSSLRASLALLNIGNCDEVITTPWTMVATNTAILEQGAKPVFADIEYYTLNIDPESVEEAITNKTKAIMCVHYAGCPCNLDELRKIGKEKNLAIVEDSAQALGAKYNGKFIGSTGELCCFSFQCVKIITSGDGGLITTTKKRYYEELKKRIWFGIDKDKRISSLLGKYPRDITVLGFKYTMNDISATLGLVGLRHFHEALEKRRCIAKRYNEELENCTKIELLHYPKNMESSCWMFPIHVRNRSRFARHMKQNGIEVGIHNWRNDKYFIFGGKKDLPITEKVNNDIIHIPIHANLTEDEVDKVIKTIKEW
jgi:perosamine synthetase